MLTNVEQSPSKSLQDALLPVMKALISDELLRHSDMDVKVSVVSCIAQITRITAPDAPYGDDHMKVHSLTFHIITVLRNIKVLSILHIFLIFMMSCCCTGNFSVVCSSS